MGWDDYLDAVVGEDAASEEGDERGGDGGELHFGWVLVGLEVCLVWEL